MDLPWQIRNCAINMERLIRLSLRCNSSNLPQLIVEALKLAITSNRNRQPSCRPTSPTTVRRSRKCASSLTGLSSTAVSAPRICATALEPSSSNDMVILIGRIGPSKSRAAPAQRSYSKHRRPMAEMARPRQSLLQARVALPALSLIARILNHLARNVPRASNLRKVRMVRFRIAQPTNQ